MPAARAAQQRWRRPESNRGARTFIRNPYRSAQVGPVVPMPGVVSPRLMGPFSPSRPRLSCWESNPVPGIHPVTEEPPQQAAPMRVVYGIAIPTHGATASVALGPWPRCLTSLPASPGSNPRQAFQSTRCGHFTSGIRWRGQDSNLQPVGYEPTALPLRHPDMCRTCLRPAGEVACASVLTCTNINTSAGLFGDIDAHESSTIAPTGRRME